MEKYGVGNPFQSEEIKERMKQTLLERYGVENPSHLSEFRKKAQQTNLERYGVEHALQLDEFMEKRRITILKNFGVDYPGESKELQARRKQTNLERHGVENPSQLEKFKEKTRQTNLERHGVEHSNQRHYSENTKTILLDKEKFIKFIMNKTVDEVAEQLNVYSKTIANYIKKYHIPKAPIDGSSLEMEMANVLKEQKIDFIRNDRIQINPLELDFYIPSCNMAIEMNGIYWHSDEQLLKRTGMLANEYHAMKTKLCEEKGIHLIHICENKWKSNKNQIVQKLLKFIS